MAKIPINIGGGGGTTSDDCTAVAADVLAGKTAIYNGSDDEAANGAMTDKSGTTSSASVSANSSSARMELTVPDEGKYDTNAKLYTPYSDLASAAGLTAAKIATGNTVAGVAGSYTGVGTAAAAQVLSGYTFSSASLSGASGSMTDKSGSTSSASSSLDSSNSRVRLQIPTNGYYNTSAYLYASYSDIASIIGLTAAKIKKGTTILGIAGTYEGADYGNIVDMFGQGMITTGNWRYASSNSDSRYNGGLHTGTSSGTSNSGASSSQRERCYLACDYSNYWSGDCRHWFPTVNAIDLRAYNYLAAYITPYYSYGSTNSNRATPFFSIGTSPTTEPSTDSVYVEGTRINSSSTSNTNCQFYLFVDLSNCNSDSVYLKVGALLSTGLGDSYDVYGYISSSLIYLYKNKSDCDIDPGSTTAQYLSY